MAESTVLKVADIDASKNAVTTYVSTSSDIFAKLQSAVTGLAGDAKFVGDASNGYTYFFDQVKPALTTNLTSLTDSLTKMLEGIQDALLGQVDPGLGKANRDASSGGADEAAAPTN